MAERLQKILAQAGYGSRRACEEFIKAGRVRINGQVAILGQQADRTREAISVDGKLIAAPEKLTYIALYKPRNVISSAEDEVGRTTVRDLIPALGRLYPVGRLDWDSEGLVLMTNDGELTNRLTHPRYGHEKEYRVLVARRPDAEQLSTWRRGVVLEDGYRTAAAKVTPEAEAGKGAWLRVTMGEGRKRQIREVAAQLGLPIVRIVRVRIGTLILGRLRAGEWRYLTDREIDELKGKARPISPTVRPRGKARTTNRHRTDTRRPNQSPRGGQSRERRPRRKPS
jgi:23S rRNA pseudouridine2605 synthase